MVARGRDHHPKVDTTYDEGELDGSYESWYRNGRCQTMEEPDRHAKTGLVIDWFENGNKKAEGLFEEDTPNGRFMTWYESKAAPRP